MLQSKRFPLPPSPPLPPPYAGSHSNLTTRRPRPSTRPSTSSGPVSAASDAPSRPLPAPPAWLDVAGHFPASSGSPFPSRLPPSRSPIPSPTLDSASSLSLSLPHFPLPPQPVVTRPSRPLPPIQARPRSLRSTKSTRSAFSISASKISKATRHATAWFVEHAARKDVAEAAFEKEQKKLGPTAWGEADAKLVSTPAYLQADIDPRIALIQAKANEAVKACIQSLLTHDLPSSKDCDTILKRCDQICTNGGLYLSSVLQEPLIDGKPPVYWAILNWPMTSSQNNDAALHTLVFSILDYCQPLNDTTISAIRLACMVTSNNILLQHLFWHFPALSPLSRSDSMLLGSAGSGDVVDVNETQDGSGTFFVRIQIRRFRLRMRVSKLVKVEFVTSDRIWTTTFSAATKHMAFGRTESQWLLSFGLADHSVPACVDGDFLVLRRLPSVSDGDNNFETTFSFPLGSCPSKIQPGSDSSFKIRLDDGPMRPHLLNESLALVDGDGTLHAQFNIRLTQAQHSTPSVNTIPVGFNDAESLLSSVHDTRSYSTHSKQQYSSLFKIQKRNQGIQGKEKKVYTSLRRGGR